MVAFLLDFAVMAGVTATPFFVLRQLGGGAVMMGVFGGLAAVAYAGMSLGASGLLSRAKDSMKWAVGGVTCFAVLFSLMPFFRNPAVCCVLSMAGMASLGFVWPALHSWVGSDPEPARRGRLMALFNLSWTSGFAVAPLFAGPMFDYDYRLPFALLFGLCVLVVLLIRSLPHEGEYFDAVTEELLEDRADHDRASEAYLFAGWCACFVVNALVSVLRSVFPKRIEDLVLSGDLRLLGELPLPGFLTAAPATTYSWLAFSMAAATAVAFIILGATKFWHHRFSYLFWLQVAAAWAFWTLGSTRSLVMMGLCFAVVGVSLGMGFFSGVYYSLVDPARKHRRTAVNEAAVGIGGFAGSLFIGYLAGRHGLGSALQSMPYFMAIAMAGQWVLIRHGLKRMRTES